MSTASSVVDVEPSADDLVASASALIPKLREEQAASEQRGYFCEELSEAFRAAGFYRLLTPRRFGGLEIDVATLVKVLVEIGRGDPGTAWNLGLGAGHAFTLGAFWPDEAQREIFCNDVGYFRAPHRFTAMGKAVPVPGGYRVSGRWDYCSGIHYASHFKGGAKVVREDGSEQEVVVVVPAGQYEIIDDWGGDYVLGMRASGSNSVRIEDAFVPEHWVVPMDWRPGDREGIAPGAALNDNGLYCGRIRLFYMVELACPTVGAAFAALDEFEEIISTRTTLANPAKLRFHDVNYQRDFGRVMMLADSARGLLIRAAEEFTERSNRWYRDGEYFSPEDDERLRLMAIQAGLLACEAVELAWSTASTSAAKRGQRMQRYFRDVAMFRQHGGTQYLSQTTQLTKLHFGLPTQHGSAPA